MFTKHFCQNVHAKGNSTQCTPKAVFKVISLKNIKVNSITLDLSALESSLLKGEEIYSVGIIIKAQQGKIIESHGVMVGL